jgi:pimeloyl-ACP methyl ester carboxylesterase
MRRGFLLGFLLFSVHLSEATPIDTSQTILVGGIKQFVRIKGKDRSAPLFLFLHGGPGNSVMNYADKFCYQLEEYFVVVHWDQREAGRTKQLNRSPVPLTVDLFKEDTHQLVVALLRQFKQSKLYLAGHSWGTVLGFHIAKNYPELLYAYMPICPMINQLESERTILEKMKEKAVRTDNRVALQELSAIKIPFENGSQLYYHRKWLFEYIGSKITVSKSYVVSWSGTWLNVFNAACEDNLFESTPSFDCPVYFFVGRNDFQTNSEITARYYRQLDAPKKELFWFERSAHSLPSTEPKLMQQIIIEKILAQFD